MQIDRHSLYFSVSSQQDDERRRDYRVEDRNSRELAHKRTQAHTHVGFRTPNNYPQTQI
nr:MAG TPA: hypothetical protein [Caudoviricetes sp.]